MAQSMTSSINYTHNLPVAALDHGTEHHLGSRSFVISIIISPPATMSKEGTVNETDDELTTPDLSLVNITNGQNERGIPLVLFLEDITAFSESFTPPASAELLIGAYSDLFGKFKGYEASLTQRRKYLGMKSCQDHNPASEFMFCSHLPHSSSYCGTNIIKMFAGNNFVEKIPEIEKSLALVHHLKAKQEANETLTTRYALADAVYAKAELDTSTGIVHLWLGANVMLEYTYQEAIDLLESKEAMAKKDFQEVGQDLAFTRNQIITAEVCISRIYNWDVRRKRLQKEADEINK
jgi:prefoldin subunit 5